MKRLILFLTLLLFASCHSQDIESYVLTVNNERGLIGTAFVADGKIYTAKHVVQGLDTLTCYSYKKVKYTVVVDSLYERDIATLKFVEPNNVKGYSIATKEIKIGDDVWSIGHPSAMTFTYFKGYVQNVSDTNYAVSYSISGGMSGAPLIYKDKVYGVIVSYMPSFEITFAEKLNH